MKSYVSGCLFSIGVIVCLFLWADYLQAESINPGVVNKETVLLVETGNKIKKAQPDADEITSKREKNRKRESIKARFHKRNKDVKNALEPSHEPVEFKVNETQDAGAQGGLSGTRPVNPTAPNELIQYLSGDFTDSDGDGMTDVAEIKYGYDPQDSASFPLEPEVIEIISVPVEEAGVDLVIEIDSYRHITLRWINVDPNNYTLRLYNGEQRIYYGGHYSDYALVDFNEFSLSGNEVLNGRFLEYGADNHFVRDMPEFTIDLSTLPFPSPVVGNQNNKISYTFEDFPADKEQEYREFLKRVFPILYDRLGPPAESFNCVITNMGESSGYFMITDNGRTFLSDTDFIPRLIVHELVHAWKGKYTFTTDSNWDYDDSLSGFEEGTAEGMAFEIIHEYVRSYPNDDASLQLLGWKPYQYWSSRTTYYDSIKYNRVTGGGDFWTHNGGQTSRYSIAATTVQMMVKENYDFYKEMISLYFDKINNDPNWRSNREDLLDMWSAVVTTINGVDTEIYLKSLPVFQGNKLFEGVYVLSTIRPYGSGGDQQFAVSYVPKDGQVYWGIFKTEIDDYNLPDWVRYDPGDDAYYYIDTQNEPFEVNIFNSAGQNVFSQEYVTRYERREDGTATGFGWLMTDEAAMQNFSVGLYKESVTFNNFIAHDPNASEDFYIFGLDGLNQNRDTEYLIMIGVDGVAQGDVSIVIDGISYTEPIISGAAVFRSYIWPPDLEDVIPVTVTDENSTTHTYYRTILEAGTYWDYYQYQFIIVDKDFNGIEDPLETVINNTLPDVVQIPDQSVRIGQTVEFQIEASDAEDDNLIYSSPVLALPEGADFDPETRTFVWVPEETGTYMIMFYVDDLKDRSSMAVAIDVMPECSDDKDHDSDVDGEDLALFAIGFDTGCLEIIAAGFGHHESD